MVYIYTKVILIIYSIYGMHKKHQYCYICVLKHFSYLLC